MGLIAQEVSMEPMIEIPDEVRDIYRLYRPTPLFRARAFEEALDTPAHIYYKSEHVSPVGSHKLNTAIVQAYVNKKEGVKRIATETGAGQWGSAMACVCKLIGLECMVYMVRVSDDQKPYRRIMMTTYGADIVASPSNLTHAGRHILAESPDSPGSLGIAIAEVSARLAAQGLPERVMVDCSHGNSQRDYRRQADVASDVAGQIATGSRRIFGAMLESNIVEGRQDYVPGQSTTYGQSITDACIAIGETERILDELARAQQARG